MTDKILKGRVCLVTGGTRGIGRAIALRLAAEAAQVVVTYRGDNAGAEETSRLLEDAGALFRIVQSDLTVAGAAEELMALIDREFGRLDALVNNAGRTFDGAFAALATDDYLPVLGTNLIGTMRLCTAAVPLLVKTKGTIVNLSSLAGIVGKEGQVVYSTTKGGINGLTRLLARTLGAHSVRVNSIAPGFIRTDMVVSLPESTYAHVLDSTASHTMGEPEDVANLALFLASDQSAYVNGTVVRIDGGFHR